MKSLWFVKLGMMFGAAGLLCLAVALSGEPSPGAAGNAKGDKPPASDSQVADKERISVELARDRAKIMHDIYTATLDVMHRRYFHGERAVVPARAMEDVFSEIKRESKVEARWISVNSKAMSIDHEPKSDFEKKAATEIAAGKTELEVVEGGYYRRAGAISLTGGCINCHMGMFNEFSTAKRFAGLVISVPVVRESGRPR